MAGYIPTKDADLLAWTLNWTTRVTATPALYGLTAPIAAACAGLFTTFNTAYQAAVSPTTRSPTTVAAKDSAKGAMVPVLRLYSQQVKANDAVSNANKEALGIHIDDTVPTPIPAPTTAPIVSITDSGVLEMNLRFADELSPSSRRKPFGAPGLLLFRKIGTVPATDPDGAEFVGFYTRIPMAVGFGAPDQGKMCTFFARWTNTKGEEGPWSTATSRIVT
jgi:hypothetical protein